ncbi:uncharacterized protein LOC120213888 [Hibiscus syriacus]|uniref:uncharacterized protein LOC120213888 n=1 Tax=Hibiscus syriacus TaxID=106335 RepID=UPI001924AF71|nr:uncharacterized protein LOC120213888 [Hibiscus syriacus]
MIHGLLGDSFSSLRMIWDELTVHREKVSWDRLVWHLGHVPKFSVIAWMAVLDRLPTKARLLSFGLHIDGMCEFCSNELESRDHLFFTCCFTKAVRAGVLRLCNLSRGALDWSEEFFWAYRQLKGRSLSSTLLRLV